MAPKTIVWYYGTPVQDIMTSIRAVSTPYIYSTWRSWFTGNALLGGGFGSCKF